mmetsp:Transcript_38830/g.99276  ORF Transcript_38830/g.99276 Transcript_38830/m.99276 type:complete len:235 (+) Transcript_38830:123-827(+)
MAAMSSLLARWLVAGVKVHSCISAASLSSRMRAARAARSGLPVASLNGLGTVNGWLCPCGLVMNVSASRFSCSSRCRRARSCSSMCRPSPRTTTGAPGGATPWLTSGVKVHSSSSASSRAARASSSLASFSSRYAAMRCNSTEGSVPATCRGTSPVRFTADLRMAGLNVCSCRHSSAALRSASSRARRARSLLASSVSGFFRAIFRDFSLMLGLKVHSPACSSARRACCACSRR